MQENDCGKNCTLFLIVFVWCLLINNVVFGYTCSQLWLWFLVPLGIPAIGILQSVGLSTIFNLFLSGIYWHIGRKKIEDKMDSVFEKYKFFFIPVFYLSLLLVGYLVHLLMISPLNF